MIAVNNNRLINLLIKGILVLFIIIVALPVRAFDYLTDLKSRSKGTLVLIFCIATSLSQPVSAQAFKIFADKYELGLESSFGIKSFTLSSNIPSLNNLQVVGEGGTVGVVVGAKGLVAKVRQGFFYSAASVSQTIDEVRSAAVLNFYPFHFINSESRFRPYIIFSLERNGYKMHGYYDGEDHSTQNFSVSEAPCLGKISAVQSGIGAGLEHRIKVPGHFVALFGEAHYSKAVDIKSSNELFLNTRPSAQMSVNIGVAFGYYR